MESIIFEIKDKSGRKVHLSKERWKHITMKHTNITDKTRRYKRDFSKSFINNPTKI